MGLVTLSNESGSAVISAHAGATLRSLKTVVDGREYELISGGDSGRLDEAQTPSGVGSFIMAPWVNRIHRGELDTDHGRFTLPVESGTHAMHGIVRRAEWSVVDQAEASATFEFELKEPWPFAGKVTYAVELAGPSLRQVLTLSATDGEHSFPGAVGWHPWFNRSLGSAEMSLRVDAVAQWEIDSDMVPSGKLGDTDAARRLRDGGNFDVGDLDDCFLFGGTRTAELAWPELTLRMKSSPTVTHAMVYTPVHSICVEPQTSAVNAFQLAQRGIENTGTHIVSQGDPLVAETEWSWSRE